jgi:integrase
VAKPLTIKTLENIKPGAVRKEIPDGLTRGLFFIIQPSGKTSWAVRYRVSGRNRKLTLGTYPAIGLKAARELASRALIKVAEGGDPAAEKQAAKAARLAPPGPDLIEKVGEQFIARHIRATLRPSWAHEAERMVRKEIMMPWKGRKLAGITKVDIHELLDAIVDRPAPIVANRTYAVLRRMCTWARQRGIIEVSPCTDIERPAPEHSRDRVLTDDELKAVWRSCEELGWPFGSLVRFLILTGQRRGEVAGMRWSELDLAGKAWMLPKERTKNNQAHAVPLSRQAVEILEKAPRFVGEFVFTLDGETLATGFGRAKTRLDAALPGAPHWTLHDLRRTVATSMARLGVALPTVEKVLNHRSGSFRGIVGVYQRHDYASEMRAALELWGAHIDRLTSGAVDNIIALNDRLAERAC